MEGLELDVRLAGHVLHGSICGSRRTLTLGRGGGSGQPPLCARQLEDERGTCTGLRTHVEAAAHSLRELARDVEAEPGSARRPRELRIAPVELLENRLLLLLRDPGAGIGDGDPYHARCTLDADTHRTAAVFDGVVDQVEEHLLNPIAVAGRT